MDLFQHQAQKMGPKPLAERMRPKTLDEVVGQEHLLGPQGSLRRLLNNQRLPSLLLFGPPGTGKTTLAEILAQNSQAYFEKLSAVSAKKSDIMRIASDADERRAYHSKDTVLFLDEIHRFNKAQQDALLPFVERGILILIGATTENPSFEVNAALLSRMRTFVLESLSQKQLLELARRTLVSEQGLKNTIQLEEDALETLVRRAGGDARRLLGSLELIDSLFAKEQRTLGVEDILKIEENQPIRHDARGDDHYQVVSAFIKSMRQSDPDASVYYLVRMLEGGEDPKFILRRIAIFASEDIGNADPQAIQVASAAQQNFQFMGLPEGVLPLTQAVLYMAQAPKSNTALQSYVRARKDVLHHGPLPVPKKLRNANSGLMKAQGYGKGYQYPHDFAGNYYHDECLPEALLGQRYLDAKSERESLLDRRPKLGNVKDTPKKYPEL